VDAQHLLDPLHTEPRLTQRLEDAAQIIGQHRPPDVGERHVRQKRRVRIEVFQNRRADLGDDSRGKAVDAPETQIDRCGEFPRRIVPDTDVQKIVRHEVEEVERLELALHAQRGALDLERGLDYPDLAVERAAFELVVEALERLGAREERAPRVVERGEVLAQSQAREM
jgi:hypothetical protein